MLCQIYVCVSFRRSAHDVHEIEWKWKVTKSENDPEHREKSSLGSL